MRTRTRGEGHFVTVRGAEQKMREQKKLFVEVHETHFCSSYKKVLLLKKLFFMR